MTIAPSPMVLNMMASEVLAIRAMFISEQSVRESEREHNRIVVIAHRGCMAILHACSSQLERLHIVSGVGICVCHSRL